ncbi:MULTISPECIES: hypothetical protein [Microcystis]|jgi:hypothetical protein|nr:MULTISPECIES: hypothetical protein [Microcystis]MCZ8039411.1 hypothetical protein [Microcystis sp. LE17-20A]MCZ8210600.1 hypothetical protein [Microcystis sp. LE19-8.1F]
MENFDLRLSLLNAIENLSGLANLYRIILIIVLFIFVVLALSPTIFNESKVSRFILRVFSEPVFLAWTGLAILAGRWPVLLAPSINSDEDQFIAAAMTLVKEPAFWRSVDTGSSGPLNIIPLTIPALLNIRIDYASARVIGLFLVILSVIFFYYSLKYLYDNRVARIATIPVVLFFSLAVHSNFVHYSGEHFPIAILSTALWITCYVYTREFSDRMVFIFGAVIGMMPYAKMQGLPVALAITLIFAHILWTRKESIRQFLKSLATLALGLLLFSAINLFFLILFSTSEDFWRRYILQNLLIYADVKNLAFGEKFSQFISMASSKRLNSSSLFQITSIFLIAATILFFRESMVRRKLFFTNTFIFFFYSLFILVVSIYVAVRPGNPFPHYLLFLVFPCGFLIGVVIGEIFKLSENNAFYKQIQFLILLLMIAASFLQGYTLIRSEHPYLSQRQKYLQDYQTPLVRTILQYASPNDSMAIWGKRGDLYIETGLYQGVRDVGIKWMVFKSPQQAYYLKSFADDLLKSKSKVFVDAMAGEKKIYRYDAYPEIATVIENNYRMVDEVEGIRIYVRK